MKLSEHVQIDDENDVVTICGIRYAGALFRGLGEALPVGRLFHVEKREDGVLTIFQHAKTDAE
jgi:hypothetical protein